MDETQQTGTTSGASTTSAPSVSTPASTAPATSTTATTDRPSFGEALDTFNSIRVSQGKSARGLAPGEQPSPIATAQPEGATIPPAGATAPVPIKDGPIPFDVHTRSMENARAKERQAVEQEFRQRYQPLERFNTDRMGFIADMLNEALDNPELAPQIRSLAGRALGGRNGQMPAAEPDQMPQPDFEDGQGNRFYSARAMQALDEWRTAKVKADILAEVQPNLAQVETIAQRERQREQQQQQTQWRDKTLEKARSLPYFAEHEADIKQVYLSLPPTSGHPAEEAAALREAYDRVVLPKLSQLEHDKAVTSMRTRASASTLNPASTGAPGGVPKNVRAKDGGTMRDALKWATAQTSGR